MKINVVDALRDRGTARAILDPSDPRLVTGSPEEQAQARAEWNRHRFAHQVLSSDLEEIPRSRLQPLRGTRVLEDTETGSFYMARTDGLMDLEYAKGAVAYFHAADETPVLLERPTGGPRSRAELEQRQAEREQRRNAPRPRRQAMRR